MPSTINPSAVTLLRDAAIHQKPIQLFNAQGEVVQAMSECTHIKFTPGGDEDTATTASTPFLRHTDTHIKKSAHNSNYTLDTLVFLIQHASMDNSAYFKECREQHIDHVSIVDKRKILDYLTGKIDNLPTVATEKRSREDEGSTSTALNNKKQKASQKDDITKAAVKRTIAHERELETRTSVLQGSKSFDKLGEMVKATLFATSHGHSKAASGTGGPGRSHQTNSSAAAHEKNGKQAKLSVEDKIPIIIVPAAPTAKLNLYNIKDFLQNETFVDAQELRASGEKKPEQVTVERRRPNGQTVVYHVVDSVSHFKQSDWDRVCCVLASGQQWQFKGWKWEKPLDVFSNVKGFYPKWTSDKVTGPASEWNVKYLDIHRDRRYMDRAAVVDFWQKLDAFNSKQKSFLNY